MIKRDFLFVAMAKVEGESLEDAYLHLYETLCIPGDIGFYISSYAITGKDDGGIVFVDTDKEKGVDRHASPISKIAAKA